VRPNAQEGETTLVSDKVQAGSNQPIWASDVMAATLRELGFPYVALVPGASYAALHDSIVNFLGNHDPKILLCLHEEHAAFLGSGYAQVTGDPLLIIVHTNVGLMHASMGIFRCLVRAPADGGDRHHRFRFRDADAVDRMDPHLGRSGGHGARLRQMGRRAAFARRGD
jgi:hypothetical protein